MSPRPPLRGLLAASCWLALAAGGCGAAGGAVAGDRFAPGTRWGARVYALENFAYFPTETAHAAWLPAEAGAPALVVVPTRHRKVVAFDAADGVRRWELETLGGNVAAPVALPGTEDLIIASLDGAVYRVNRRNGRLVWRSDRAGHGVAADPVVVGSGDTARIVLTSLKNRVAVLSAANGELQWFVDREHDAEMTLAGHGGALVVGDAVVAGFSDGYVGAWALEDGARLWLADLGEGDPELADVDATPVAVKGPDGESLVVLSVNRRGLVALTADGGDLAWQVRGAGFLSPDHDAGLLVAPQVDGLVWGIDAASGKVLWRTSLGTGAAGEVALSREYVFAPSGRDLAVLDRGTGRVMARWGDGRGLAARPVFAHGELYLVGHSGFVWSLEVH
jgi:outer membrane protein assembly factor BamB